MSGVEFRLGHTDHLVVEEFLSGRPAGVDGILVDEKNLAVQSAAIDAARIAGIAVHVEPLTDRLEAEGFSTRGLNYGYEVIDPATDLRGIEEQDKLVDAVVGPQLDVATAVTPPHFFVESEEALNLNLSLLRRTRQQFDGPPVRPILAVQRTFLDEPALPDLIARRYLREGASQLDLRISPLGGEQEGPVKIQSVMRILEGLRAGGIDVVMGSQSTIGEVAFAMGLASGFWAGIGYREQYNHKRAIAQQRRPSRSGKGPRGPVAGVYVAQLAMTVPRKRAETLYSDREVRTRLICGMGSCQDRIDGPVQDPRGHYLHARASEVANILDRPPRWRPMLQRDRLVRAIDLRETVNRLLPVEGARSKTRTLRTLVGELDDRMEQLGGWSVAAGQTP